MSLFILLANLQRLAGNLTRANLVTWTTEYDAIRAVAVTPEFGF